METTVLGHKLMLITLRRECFDSKSYHAWSLAIEVTNAYALNCN